MKAWDEQSRAATTASSTAAASSTTATSSSKSDTAQSQTAAHAETTDGHHAVDTVHTVGAGCSVASRASADIERAVEWIVVEGVQAGCVVAEPTGCGKRKI